MEELLSVKNLNIKIKDRTHKEFYAVRGLDFSVYKASALGIVGESGSGKSVTALAIMGLSSRDSQIESGSLSFLNKDLLRADKNELSGIRGKDISMIFQDPMTGLNPLIKIGKQVEESLLLHTGYDKERIRLEAFKAMEYTGLKDVNSLYNAYPHQLSGGMRQRVMIASAIVTKPKLIIADEPTTALDSTTQTQILDLFKRLKKESCTSIFFISHNFGVINYISDYIGVMYGGFLLEYGKREEITANPLHPYTKALIKCIPSPDKKGAPLYSIRNNARDTQYGDGCPFAGRCDHTIDKCLSGLPKNYYGERFVRCARIGEI